MTVTLDHMARGGIRDHLGGGYHRYATDRYWIVPHFEKMLYDNAQLASVHLAAFEITGDPRWRAEAEATFAFVAAEDDFARGGFYSALDAETKGEEGAYYVWTRDEVKAALGDSADAAAFAQVYGLDRRAEYRGRPLRAARAAPRAEQAERTRDCAGRARGPAGSACASGCWPCARSGRRRLRDDKISLRLERPDDRGLCRRAIACSRMKSTARPPKRPPTSCSKSCAPRTDGCCGPTGEGSAKLPAYLEDYAFLAHGLLRLHRATGDARWLREAQALVDRMIADFEDKEEGGFFFTASDHEQLLARAKDPFDSALPSGNSMAILDLIELYRLSHKQPTSTARARPWRPSARRSRECRLRCRSMLLGLGQYLDERPDSASEEPAAERDHERSGRPGRDGDDPGRRGPVGRNRAGRRVCVTVKLAIKPGWHIYANPTGVAELSPTKLEVHPGSRRCRHDAKDGLSRGRAEGARVIGKGKGRPLRKRSRDQGALSAG